MAAYKSEVLDRTYRGRLRPRSHYALGWLPRWGRLITRFSALSTLINLTTGTPGLRRLCGGAQELINAGHCPGSPQVSGRASGCNVVGRQTRRGLGRLVLDCFTGEGAAAVAVLSAAGYAPQFLDRPACCGLTWISTGQRDGAGASSRPRWMCYTPTWRRGRPSWDWSRRASPSGAATLMSCLTTGEWLQPAQVCSPRRAARADGRLEPARSERS